MLLTTLFETIRILSIFVLFYILIPLLFAKKSNNALPLLERFFFGFVCIILFQIITVHLLVSLKLFDIISVCALPLICATVLIKRDQEKDMFITRLFSNIHVIYDAFDTGRNRQALVHKITAKLSGIRINFITFFKKIRKAPVFYILSFIVLILSAAVRFWHSLCHYAYPHMDMYQDLKGVKALMVNQLYLNGRIYPKGMHSPMAYIAELTYTDPYWISRYFGPFYSLLLVLAIYQLAYKVSGNKYLSLFAMAIYGLITNNGLLPSQVFRQTATLPQEFGMLLIVLGFAFLIDYIKTSSRRKLFAFEACLFIGLISHSFSGLFLVIWTAILIIFCLLFRKLKWITTVKLVGISALVSVVACLPLVIGPLLGKVFHETSLEMVTDVSGIRILDVNFKQFLSRLLMPSSILMYFLLLSCICLLISFFIKKIRVISREELPIYLSLFTSTLLLYIAFYIPDLITAKKLPELLDQKRTGPFLSLLLPIVVASLIYHSIDLLIRQCGTGRNVNRERIRNLLSCGTVAVFVIISLASKSYSLNTFYRHMEYDQAAKAYVRIKSDFYRNPKEYKNWYVISTDPQFAEVKNYGWYDEGYQFVHRYTKEEVMNPQFRFDYPVNHIFIFVEKKPLFGTRTITPEYGETRLEPLGDDPFMQFYQDGDNRAIMEGHIWMLAEAYAKTHNGVSIYYEDDDFMIYRIDQE